MTEFFIIIAAVAILAAIITVSVIAVIEWRFAHTEELHSDAAWRERGETRRWRDNE